MRLRLGQRRTDPKSPDSEQAAQEQTASASPDSTLPDTVPPASAASPPAAPAPAVATPADSPTADSLSAVSPTADSPTAVSPSAAPKRAFLRRRGSRKAAAGKAEAKKADPRRADPKKPSRTTLLALIIALGIGAVAVAATGALIAVPRFSKMATFSAPLYVYPVNQTTVGQCQEGTNGLNGQSPSGPACYQVGKGISVRKVNDIHAQRTATGGHEVSISLLPADRRAFSTLTRSMVGRDVAFVVRGRLVTATRVESPITKGKVIISGNFSRPDADRLIHELKGSG